MKLFSNAQKAEAADVGQRRLAAMKGETVGDTFDLILAGYPALEPAQKDFDELVRLVKEKQIKSDGLILVTRDAAGEVHVTDTGTIWPQGRRLGRRRRCPRRSRSAPHGRRRRRRRRRRRHDRRFAKHKVDSGLEAGMGDKLKPGTAATIPWSTKRTLWLRSGH